ncbi:MAG: hypothetical protein JO353_02925, partial [Phycisphaerae bacterium]|nr:hypothetical protein [Phycisphaerae bacterium]
MTAARKSPRQKFRSAVIFCLMIGGCGSAIHPATQPFDSFAALSLNQPTRMDVLNAQAVPPLGWKPDPLKQSSSHAHEVWLSPDGRTAYGIIYFHMPLPVGRDFALWAFMNQMKQTEGEAILRSKSWDEQRGCERFVAEGGLY